MKEGSNFNTLRPESQKYLGMRELIHEASMRGMRTEPLLRKILRQKRNRLTQLERAEVAGQIKYERNYGDAPSDPAFIFEIKDLLMKL